MRKLVICYLPALLSEGKKEKKNQTPKQQQTTETYMVYFLHIFSKELLKNVFCLTETHLVGEEMGSWGRWVRFFFCITFQFYDFST